MLDLVACFLILLHLTSLLPSLIREESGIEALDVLLQGAADVCVKAVNQVLLEVANHALARVAVVRVDLVDKMANLGPRLCLSVLRD